MHFCAGYIRRACSPLLSHPLISRSPNLRAVRRLPLSRQLSIVAMSQQAEGGAAGAASAVAARALDREQFRERLQVKALRVPTKQCSKYMSLLSRHLLNKPKLKNIQDIQGDREHKMLLLNEQLTAEELPGLEIGRGDQKSMTVGALMEADGLQLGEAQVEVDYSYFTAGQVLQRILPPDCEVPSSFEAVGHIAHLNLREELLPWKHVIGQVILDKNPRLRVVVNKVGTIENEWRVFQMEVLAAAAPAAPQGAGSGGQEQQQQQQQQQLEGEEQQGKQQQGDGGGEGGRGGEGAGVLGGAGSLMVTEVRQHGARFRLDFSKVYWNSRLETEHHRLVREVFAPGDTVLDVMAGIGPFAIPAAQKGCTVWANDLNPDSFRWLRANIALNRVAARVVPFNLDGREVIRLAAGGALPLAAAVAAAAAAAEAEAGGRGGGGRRGKAKGAKGGAAGEQEQAQQAQQQRSAQQAEHGGVFQHAVMNLPASAVEFLDAFRGAFDPALWAGVPLPLVHVYTFCRDKEEDAAGMQRRVEAALGGPLDDTPSFHLVRDVAPNKKMYCITFRVPASLAFQQPQGAAGGATAAAEGAGGAPAAAAAAAAAEGAAAEGAAGLKRQKVA